MEEWLYLPEARKQHNILRYLVDLITRATSITYIDIKQVQLGSAALPLSNATKFVGNAVGRLQKQPVVNFIHIGYPENNKMYFFFPSGLR